MSDFHTPKDLGDLAFETDKDYKDYDWILGRTREDGTWYLMTQGY